MKRVKYLLPLIVCTFVYVLVSITVGQSSINCYQNLNYQKKLISKQTSNLQNINNELILELTALKNDKEHFNMEMDEPLCKNKVPREGVVIRIDNDPLKQAFKLKTDYFYGRESKMVDNGEVDIEMENGYGEN